MMNLTSLQQHLANRAPRLWLRLAALLLLAVALLNAWVCDDAYITFRTCFNLTEGYGPLYNVGERVQTFTNPLWMLLVSGFYAFTGEAFFTSLAISLVLLAATIWVYSQRIFTGSWALVLVMVCMACSRSFVEFSTSGLENVLNGFLLTVFVAIYLQDAREGRKLFWMSLVASLGMVSRMDTALLYAPALAFVLWQNRSWRAIGEVVLGCLPFICWETFSIIYYGFPFPNTAYAKLNAGIGSLAYMTRGLDYFWLSCKRDPMTMAVIAFGCVVAFGKGMRTWLPIGLGILFYLIYILRIGGDFMEGRFFHLPSLGGFLVLTAWLQRNRAAPIAAAAFLIVGICNPMAPGYNGWRPVASRATRMHNGIADERGWYHDVSSLIAYNDTMWVLENERNLDRNATVEQKPVMMFWDFLGFMGYGAGPTVSYCDRYALVHPLLARLPMVPRPNWRVGHFERAKPRGFHKTMREGANHLQDEGLCQYYDHLYMITQGPIWSWQRWQTIWHMNLDHYEYLIDKDFYREPAPQLVQFAAIQQPHPRGEKFRANGQVEIWTELPLRIELGEAKPFPFFEITVLSEADYVLVFWNQEKEVAELRLPQQWIGGGLAFYQMHTPSDAMLMGFDAITVEGIGGNEYYALGHLKPIYEIPNGN